MLEPELWPSQNPLDFPHPSTAYNYLPLRMKKNYSSFILLLFLMASKLKAVPSSGLNRAPINTVMAEKKKTVHTSFV